MAGGTNCKLASSMWVIPVHRSLPKICHFNIAVLTERTWWHHPSCQKLVSSSQTHYAYAVQYVCRCPSVWIGPREDESVSVMRLEKKSSIHNLNVFAMQCIMRNAVLGPYFSVFFPSNLCQQVLPFWRLMSRMCSSVCETFSYSALMCWAWRVAKAIELVGKGLKRSSQHSFICIMSEGAPFPTNRISSPLAITNHCFLSRL